VGTPETADKADRARLEFERGLKVVNEVWVYASGWHAISSPPSN